MTMRPITIRVESLTKRAGVKEYEVNIQSAPRSDLLEVYQTLPKGSYRFLGYGKHAIKVESWNLFLEKIESLEKLNIVYIGDVRSKLREYIERPRWTIELNRNSFQLIPGQAFQHWDVQAIIGIEYNSVGMYYRVPLPEGWRIPSVLKDLTGIIYTPEASEAIVKQIEQRKAIDEVATAKDWSYDVKFKDESVIPRPAQRVAMAFTELVGFRDIISYEMGLGKTIISLGVTEKNQFRTLIIAPASLKSKWAKEIFRLTGQKPIVLMGTRPTNQDTLELLGHKSGRYYLCNYETIAKPVEVSIDKIDEKGVNHRKVERRFFWIDLINTARFDMIIIDESHYAKNTNSNRSQAISRLKSKGIMQLTGTPILNRVGEYFPTLHLLRPDLFPSEMEFLRAYTYNGGKGVKNVAQLHEMLKTVMIRRRQKDVRDEVPPKNIMPKYHELSPKALKLYQKVEEGIYEMIEEYVDEKKRWAAKAGDRLSVTHILAKIQRLKQICAIDKVEATADLAYEAYESAEQNDRKWKKVLISTQFKGVARAIKARLGHEALGFVDRDLNTASEPDRMAMIEEFQSNPKIKFLIVTEKTASEGHDITEAGTVIFNDLFWTPARHEQGEARAYMRENDPHGIDSYYQIIDMGGDSVEEWIWEMLHRKMSIINTVVDGVEASRDVSIASELIERFKSNIYTKRFR